MDSNRVGYDWRAPSDYEKGKRIIHGKPMVWSRTLQRWTVQYRPSTWQRDQPAPTNHSTSSNRSRPAADTYAAMHAPLVSARNPHSTTTNTFAAMDAPLASSRKTHSTVSNGRNSSADPNGSPRRETKRNLNVASGQNQLATARGASRDAPRNEHASGRTGNSNETRRRILASGNSRDPSQLFSSRENQRNPGRAANNQMQKGTLPCSQSRDMPNSSNRPQDVPTHSNDVEVDSHDFNLPDVIKFPENEALGHVTDQESAFTSNSPRSVTLFEDKVYRLNKEMKSIEDQIRDEKRLIEEHSAKVFFHSKNVEKLRKERKRLRRSLTEAKKVEISQMLKRVAELEQEVKDADGSASPQSVPSIQPLVVYKPDSDKLKEDDDDDVTFLGVKPSSAGNKRSHPSDNELSSDSSKRAATKRRAPTWTDNNGPIDV